jgi:hypothetical protein
MNESKYTQSTYPEAGSHLTNQKAEYGPIITMPCWLTPNAKPREDI